MRCVAALLESVVGALVDEESLCLRLFSTCVSSATTAAMCYAGGDWFWAGPARPVFKEPITDCVRAFRGSCELPLRLSRTITHASRSNARPRLEIAEGISASSSEH